LAISTGAGAAARQSIGTGVVGGMNAATFLAVFLVPLFFKLVNDWNFRSNPEDFDSVNKPAHGEGAAHV
jgi:Cu/Ag efflux pump CusA